MTTTEAEGLKNKLSVQLFGVEYSRLSDNQRHRIKLMMKDVQQYALAFHKAEVERCMPEKQSRTIVDAEGDLIYGHESKWDKGFNAAIDAMTSALISKDGK